MFAESKLHQITDKIHGTEFLSSLESELISTPIFYRLHDIYQSSTVYMTYPSNRTKRYEHSVGTMELAARMLFSSVTSADDETRDAFFGIIDQKLHEIYNCVKSNCNSATFNAIYLNDVSKQLLNQCLNHAGRELWDVINSINHAHDKFNVFRNMALDQFQYYPTRKENEPNGQEFRCYFCYRVLLQAVRIVALFHDVGHPPYSHIIEEVLTDLYEEASGDEEKVAELKDILRPYISKDDAEAYKVSTPFTQKNLNIATHERIGVHFLETAISSVFPQIMSESRIRGGTGIPPTVKAIILYYVFVAEFTIAIFSDRDVFFKSLHQLIDGCIDADRLDYIERDSINCGVDWGSIPYDRIIMPMKLMKKEGGDPERFIFAFPTKVEEDITDLLVMRYKIFARINFHHRSMKTATALQTCVKLLARNFLENDDGNIINHDICILWKALNVGAGDLATRIMQWNDSWLISTLQYALIDLEDPENEFSGPDVDLLRINLREVLLNHKKYISVFKRGQDCKEFAEQVFKKTTQTRADFEELLQKERQKKYEHINDSEDVLDSDHNNAKESDGRINAIFKYLDTGDMKLLAQIISNEPSEILCNALDEMKDAGEIEDYRYIVNQGREKTGLPARDGDYKEIYLYNREGLKEMDTHFALEPQIEAIHSTIPWLFFYIRPIGEERIREKAIDKMAEAIAKEINTNMYEVFDKYSNRVE